VEIIRSLNTSLRNQFDYREIFLTSEAGVLNQEKAKIFATAAAFHDGQIEKTRNDFAGIDYNNMNSAAIDKIQEIAQTVLEKVKRGVKVYDPIPTMFNKTKGEMGKKVEAHEIEGAKVYGFTYGAVRRVSSLKHKTYTVDTAPSAVHLEIPVEQLKTGRYTTADLVFNATQAILRDKIALAYNTLNTAYVNGTTYTTDNGGGGSLAQVPVNTAIDKVADYEGGSITLIGRGKVVAPISDFVGSSTTGGLSDAALEEVRRQGFLSYYRGANIIRLSYVKDEVYGLEPFGTANVFVLSAEKSFNRFVEVTPITKRAWVEPATGMLHMIFEYEDGAAVWKLQYGNKIYNI